MVEMTRKIHHVDEGRVRVLVIDDSLQEQGFRVPRVTE